jgi:hypothetical protein
MTDCNCDCGSLPYLHYLTMLTKLSPLSISIIFGVNSGLESLRLFIRVYNSSVVGNSAFFLILLIKLNDIFLKLYFNIRLIRMSINHYALMASRGGSIHLNL